MHDLGYVLDTTVVAEVARGEVSLIALLCELDARGVQLIIPALVVAAVAAEQGGGDPSGFLPAVRGIGRLRHGAYGGLGDFDNAVEIGRAAERLGDKRAWEDAHTVVLARLWRARILTLDGGRWGGYDHDGVQVTEISDPEDS